MRQSVSQSVSQEAVSFTYYINCNAIQAKSTKYGIVSIQYIFFYIFRVRRALYVQYIHYTRVGVVVCCTRTGYFT